ncbi:MAG: IS4 family transposase [Flavobacteriales bacterium]|nr:MAG: IS4 family transposase [Flavobacteriales bacterium]
MAPRAKHKTNRGILSAVRRCLASDALRENFRRSPRDFTRERKMPFKKVVLFMLSLSRRSLRLELTGFVRAFADGVRNVTGSAFNQSRRKVEPGVFKELMRVMNQEFYTDNDERVKRWEGFRLLATDGSIINLPHTQELKERYGGTSNQHGNRTVQARCSVLYDVLNNMVLHGTLAPCAVGERELALQHLHMCQEGDLVIYDRGYPGFPLMLALQERGTDFVMRCKHSFNKNVLAFVRSTATSNTLQMAPGHNTPITWGPGKHLRLDVRMVKVLLDNGELEVLLTSLTDEQRYPTAAFKDLYRKRWGVERFYNTIKNIARVEHFTGHTDVVIQQDFHAALFMCNLHALLLDEAQDQLPAEHPARKLSYKINNNVSFGYMKQEVMRIMAQEDDEQTMRDLSELFLSTTVPIRPGRTFPRDRDKYRTRDKPVYLTNSKPAL